MANADEFLSILKKFVDQELRAELERHAEAGLPISRKQALDMANANQRDRQPIPAGHGN